MIDESILFINIDTKKLLLGQKVKKFNIIGSL